MAQKTFKALVVTETTDQKFVREIKDRSIDELPPGEVLIKVLYSSLNYKDALSAVGNRGVTRNYPHTPGIDAAGIVEESNDKNFRTGEEVFITGYDLGMNTSGGFGQYIRVPANWIVRLPANLTLRESMIYGTAGFTAGLSVHRLVSHGMTPDQGEILVTGSTGGVGSMAIALLAKLGYQVVAATTKLDQKEYLHQLGAQMVIDIAEVDDASGRALLKSRWAAVVDTVGGNILATAIKSTKQRAMITCCGNVASADFSINVYPFILRGVALFGIDSATCPMELRLKIWQKLATEWKLEALNRIANEISLDELNQKIKLILEGKIRGRVLVNLFKFKG